MIRNFCKMCGARLGPNADFCHNCGCRLDPQTPSPGLNGTNSDGTPSENALPGAAGAPAAPDAAAAPAAQPEPAAAPDAPGPDTAAQNAQQSYPAFETCKSETPLNMAQADPAEIFRGFFGDAFPAPNTQTDAPAVPDTAAANAANFEAAGTHGAADAPGAANVPGTQPAPGAAPASPYAPYMYGQPDAGAVPQPAPQYAPPVPQMPPPYPYYAPGPWGYGAPQQPELISTGGYLGMFLIGMIPLAGLIYLIVQAAGNQWRPNRRNFARGFLAARAIAIAAVYALVLFAGIFMRVAGYYYY